MEAIKTVLVGIGGYAVNYIDYFEKGIIDWNEISLEGIVDPVAGQSSCVDMLKKRGVPFYSDLNEFFKEKTAQLVIISSPINFHREQCETALMNGADVLCEKPLVTCLEDYESIRKAERASGKRVGVGFQWSFSKTMLSLKHDIMNGTLGKPVLLKTLICWPRPESYYTGSDWKGRRRDSIGRVINDSVVANATAHYLHNIFFLLGKGPKNYTAELYRGKEIETFDTCYLNGKFDDGAKFFYAASHAGKENYGPVFHYEFENAVVSFNERINDSQVMAKFSDGSEKFYGNPFTIEETAQKVIAMLNYIKHGHEIPCSTETVYPHVEICDKLSREPVGVLVGEDLNMVDDRLKERYERFV
jgi:predicted dehydrogenase